MPCQFQSRIPELECNLLKLYGRAIPADIQQGRDWYPVARAIVREWATSYRLHDATVACVIAAISPKCEWSRNLIIADDVLAGRPLSIGGIRSNITKAQRILSDSATQTIAYFPHGPKVASFALNLAGNDDAVTVDTHAMQAAFDNPRVGYSLNWQRYLCLAEAYERAAKRVHWPSSEFQAVIWHVWKRLYPRVVKHAIRKQWESIGEF